MKNKIDRILNVVKSNLVTIAVGFFIIAIFMPVLTILLYTYPYSSSINGIMNVDNVGSTADFISGAMTPFLTISAFFLLLKGYFMQKEELAQTREEMKRSAEALDQQRKIMEEEKNITKIRNELDIFFLLFKNWENNIKTIRLKAYLSIDSAHTNKFKDCEDGYFEIKVDDYGKHLSELVKIIGNSNDFSTIKSLNSGKGKTEHQYVIDNLSEKCQPIFYGLNNIMNFIENCSENNKKIMYNAITHSLSWNEKYILNMIAKSLILGEIKDSEVERKKLKANLEKLNLFEK